jgi:iron complex outermembrane receptor protein
MVDMAYRTQVYFDSSQTERLSDPAAFVLNAQFSWRSPDERLEVGLWGKNLTAKEYLVAISPITSLGMDLLSYAPPRTYGIFFRSRY